jgi:hypothetical protein
LRVGASCGRGFRRGPQQRGEIETLGGHLERSVGVARPFGARPVAVELQSVAVRIAEVEGLAHAVVACAVELNASRAQPAKRVTERGPIGVADGEVIQPGGPWRRRPAALAFPGIQPDVMVVSPGAQEGG